MSRRDFGTKVYVGDLPREASERDIEQAFKGYGKVRNVWVARNPPGFAFVEYEDPDDATDAVRDLDGTARVEISSGKSRPKPWLRGGRDGGRDAKDGRDNRDDKDDRNRSRGFDPADRCYECGERGHYAYDCRRRNGHGRSKRSSSTM